MKGENSTGNNTIRKKWRKHHVLWWVAGTLAVLVLMITQVYADKEASTLRLEDRSGDHSALSQVTISGELSDGYHRKPFTIQGGEVMSSTEVYAYPIPIGLHHYVFAGEIVLDGKEYSVSPFPTYNGNHDYEITRRDRRAGINEGRIEQERAFVQTSLDIPITNNTISHANMLTYGLAEAEGDIYFTVPATIASSGSNGIYKLQFVDRMSGYNNDQGQLNAEEIAQFPMEAAEDQGETKLEVLGLEAVGEQLLVLLSADYELMIRSYDRVSGQQKGELHLPEVILVPSEQEALQEPFTGERHYGSYRAFVDKAENVLTLSFDSNQSTRETLRQTLISVQVTDGGLELLDQVQGSYTEGTNEWYGEQFYAHRADGKLFVIKTWNVWEDDPRIHFNIGFPKKFVIYVYENGEQIYEGELISDQNDDAIHVRNYHGGSLGYSEVDYRNYYHVRIE